MYGCSLLYCLRQKELILSRKRNLFAVWERKREKETFKAVIYLLQGGLGHIATAYTLIASVRYTYKTSIILGKEVGLCVCLAEHAVCVCVILMIMIKDCNKLIRTPAVKGTQSLVAVSQATDFLYTTHCQFHYILFQKRPSKTCLIRLLLCVP